MREVAGEVQLFPTEGSWHLLPAKFSVTIWEISLTYVFCEPLECLPNIRTLRGLGGLSHRPMLAAPSDDDRSPASLRCPIEGGIQHERLDLIVSEALRGATGTLEARELLGLQKLAYVLEHEELGT